MDLKDSAVAARLDAIGVPADVALDLSRLDVSVVVVERLHAAGYKWPTVRSLLRSPGLEESKDVSALVTLATMDVPVAEVEKWSQLGSLDAAIRLQWLLVPLATVQAFPLTREHGLSAFLRMLQTTKNSGIHVDDLLLWHTAEVLTLTPPFLVEEKWSPWRAAAANHLGMRRAAVAAAAGLSVAEAVNLVHAGEFDVDALKMMAGLRTGRF